MTDSYAQSYSFSLLYWHGQHRLSHTVGSDNFPTFIVWWHRQRRLFHAIGSNDFPLCY
jgi:hypothetical protein